MTNSDKPHGSSVRQLIQDEENPVILDARRGSIPLDELLAPAAETRAKAIAEDRLWVVNASSERDDDGNDRSEKTFCTIQPFSSEAQSTDMRAAFLSQRSLRAKNLPMFEVIGTRSEVRTAIAPMFASDEVLLRWLPKNL